MKVEGSLFQKIYTRYSAAMIYINMQSKYYGGDAGDINKMSEDEIMADPYCDLIRCTTCLANNSTA